MSYTLRPTSVVPYYDALVDWVGPDAVTAITDGSDSTYLVMWSDPDSDDYWEPSPLFSPTFSENEVVDGWSLSVRYKVVEDKGGSADADFSLIVWNEAFDDYDVFDNLYDDAPTSEWVTHTLTGTEMPTVEQFNSGRLGLDCWNYNPSVVGISDISLTVTTHKVEMWPGFGDLTDVTNRDEEDTLYGGENPTFQLVLRPDVIRAHDTFDWHPLNYVGGGGQATLSDDSDSTYMQTLYLYTAENPIAHQDGAFNADFEVGAVPTGGVITDASITLRMQCTEELPAEWWSGVYFVLYEGTTVLWANFGGTYPTPGIVPGASFADTTEVITGTYTGGATSAILPSASGINSKNLWMEFRPGLSNFGDIDLRISEVTLTISGVVVQDPKDFGTCQPLMHKISGSRALAVWPQTDNTYPLPDEAGQSTKLCAVLFDVTGTSINIVDTATWIIRDKADDTHQEWVWLYPSGGANKCVLPDGDVVMHWTTFVRGDQSGGPGTYVDEGSERYDGSTICPAVRINVTGSTISFVWKKIYGSTAATQSMSWAANIVYSPLDETLVFFSESETVKVDPETGQWLAESGDLFPATIQSFGVSVVVKGNNWVCVTGRDQTTYYKGTLSPLTYDLTEYSVGDLHGREVWLEEEYQYSVYDSYTDTWLLTGWCLEGLDSNPAEDYNNIFRCTVDDNGDLVILNHYVQDVDTWTYTPEEIASGSTWGEHVANQFGYLGSLNRWPPVPMPDNKVSHLWGGTAINLNQVASEPDVSRNEFHHTGLQMLYDWKEYDESVVPLDYGITKSGGFFSAPYAGNWPYYYEWYDGEGYDNTYSIWFDAVYLGGKIAVVFNTSEMDYGSTASATQGTSLTHIFICDPATFKIPPPLKMSYRDDDKRAGARRLSYDSENSGDIRIGRVAW